MENLQPTLQRSKPEMGSEMFILKKNPRWSSEKESKIQDDSVGPFDVY